MDIVKINFTITYLTRGGKDNVSKITGENEKIYG